MNKFVYFMAVGLAFTVLQVAPVEAQDTAAGLVTGGNAPADCGGVPCPTGDDAHTGGAEDCANLKEADGSDASPDAVAACHARQSSHADSAHSGMAAGTTAMCGGVPCTTAGATGEGMDHHVMMDPRTNPPVPFSPADEAIYQPYADECESNGGKISEASMGILIIPPHNFTRLQVERLCQESVHDDGADASCMPLADGTLPPHCK